jgi:hypothetical protein
MDDKVFALCLDAIVSEVAAQGLAIEKIKVSPEVYRQHGHLRYDLAVNNQLQGYVVQVQLVKGVLDLTIEEATIPTLDLLQVVETYEVRSRFDRL